MTHKIFNYLLGMSGMAILCFAFQSCNTDPIQIPSYVYIDRIDLDIQDPATQGSASTGIKDGWLYVDGQLIGVNNLPVRLPVLHDDSKDLNEVQVAAGILDNGISNAHVDYPLYTLYTTNVDLEPGKTDTISAVVQYDDDAIIRIVDDFESAGVSLGDDVDGIDMTTVIKTQEDVFEGAYSGKLVFDTAQNVCVVGTTLRYSNLYPEGNAAPVYVEMDYKTEVPLEIGMGAYNNGTRTELFYLGGVNETSQWNKIYFNFTADVFGKGADEYSIVFRAYSNDSIPSPNVYLDNIKLVHYQ